MAFAGAEEVVRDKGKKGQATVWKLFSCYAPPLVLRKEKGVVSKPFVFALNRGPLEVNVKQLSNKADRLCIPFTWAARKAPRLFVLYLPLSGGKIKSHRLMDLAAVLAQIYKPISCLTLLSQPEETKPSDHFLHTHRPSAVATLCLKYVCWSAAHLSKVTYIELWEGLSLCALIYTVTERQKRGVLSWPHVWCFDAHWTLLKEKQREIINRHVGSSWYSPPHTYHHTVAQLPRGFCCHGDNQIVAFTAKWYSDTRLSITIS